MSLFLGIFHSSCSGCVLLAAALLVLVLGAAVATGIPGHRRHAKARRRLAGQGPRHAPHELGGLALEGAVALGLAAAGDRHYDHEGIGGVVQVLGNTLSLACSSFLNWGTKKRVGGGGVRGRRWLTHRHGGGHNGGGVALAALGAALGLASIEGILGVLKDDGLHDHGEHIGHGRVGQRGWADERRRDVMGPVVLALLAEELDAGFRRGRHFVRI